MTLTLTTCRFFWFSWVYLQADVEHETYIKLP